MKIGLRAGHSDNCIGAIGILNEHEQMKKYYEVVKEVFEEYGHTVIDCNSNANSQNAELSEGVNKANSNNVDLFASLHMNSFNGQASGTEVLVSSTSSKAYPIAQRLVNNFAELGFLNRGVKCERLFEMNHCEAPNIISEICFCDSKKDIDIYNKYSWEQLGHVFCNAIDGNIPKTVSEKTTGYIVTGYLPNGFKGDNSFTGVDLEYVLSYFKGIRCYMRHDIKGQWIETQTLPYSKCLEFKETLGSWFYKIK
ncbi:N-acetylmuramoyl-L-alanine amidase family protein [Clostridium botulinum 202F]|nr:N-acetylmuramoyl-L-alanine amidase family protein [Clostridium botulinum 202F]KAI3346994.1 N-acetylmuramoyl-L-alanine amidase [Clostridium botulinum]KON13668.1 N-acetylmuramoyl-L-alanine amidase [Clostridium botulinum]MBY6987215.1 N-acetylmuramoyl-L-alanine amidase [Clostridium botulinum]NFG99656.1 N-acetylmuramoyl-L-alanine amidase [Clostridium botulinum]